MAIVAGLGFFIIGYVLAFGVWLFVANLLRIGTRHRGR